MNMCLKTYLLPTEINSLMSMNILRSNVNSMNRVNFRLMEKQSAQCISQSCKCQVRGISFAKITSDGHLVHLTGSDLHLLCRVNKLLPIQVTERSKARVCGRLLVGITGSNPASGMDVCFECCVLSLSGICDGAIICPEKS